jgi:hypothetical protein
MGMGDGRSQCRFSLGPVILLLLDSAFLYISDACGNHFDGKAARHAATSMAAHAVSDDPAP